MDAAKHVTVDDLWTPDRPLPGRTVLAAIADRLGQAWGYPALGRTVKTVYNPRLRSSLGRAILAGRPEDCRVELNTHLLRKHPQELLGVVAHELAHVVVHLRYGAVPPHGQHFRTLMCAVHFSAAATHNLPIRRLPRRRRSYLYLHCCSDCGYRFTARKVRRDVYCLACGPTMQWDVFRHPNTAAGRARLKEMISPSAT